MRSGEQPNANGMKQVKTMEVQKPLLAKHFIVTAILADILREKKQKKEDLKVRRKLKEQKINKLKK